MRKTTSQGDKIRALLRNAEREVVVVAPFMKLDAFKSLLEVIPLKVPIRCITRWLPKDVAAGVSDPEIIYVVKERRECEILLVDSLHAKLFIADNRCLVGSANVTLAALGESAKGPNIEILVETDVGSADVVETLEMISLNARKGEVFDAELVIRLAQAIRCQERSDVGCDAGWFPRSRKASESYAFYQNSSPAFLKQADHVLLSDIACANVPPGLGEHEFNEVVRNRLSSIPLAQTLLSETTDVTLKLSDAVSYLTTIDNSECAREELWRAFVAWMSYFYPERVIEQEITEIGLRRAQGISGM